MRTRFILWPLATYLFCCCGTASGQIVGSASTNTGLQHAFLWRNGVMSDLGTLGGSDSVAYGVNSSLQVVGSAKTAAGVNHAFLWRNGVMQDLGTLGGSDSSAFGINSVGQVVGSAKSAAGFDHAFLWSNGVMQDLGTLGGASSAAYGINDSGQVVGYARKAGGFARAFLWSNGAMQELAAPAPMATYEATCAYGINASGQAAGTWWPFDPYSALWTNGVMKLVGFPDNPYTISLAKGVNSAGQVVGWVQQNTGNRAYLWSDGVMQVLGTLGGRESEANAIDSAGDVVGFALTTQGKPHAFLWSNGVMQDLGTLGGLESKAYGIADPDLGSNLISVNPCRIMDTRSGGGFSGAFGPPSLAPLATRSIPIPSSSCGIPKTAKAYSLNVTVVPKAGSLTYLALWPDGQPQPNVSTLNSWDGSVVANAAILPAGQSGAINVFATNLTDLIIDISGYFVAPAANSLMFYPLTPCRVLDTRNAAGAFGGPALAAGVSRSFPLLSSSCGIPASAQSYSLNVTAVPNGPLGYLTVWPTGQPMPLASTLNSMDAAVVANAAIVPAGTNGDVSFHASNNAHLVVDINGYFAPPGAGGLNFYPVSPCRVMDSRIATGPYGGPILNGFDVRAVPVRQSACGLPPTAEAYSLNMTAVPTGFLAFLAAWPTGLPWSGVSTLNGYKGLAVANAALVPAGTNGAVNVYVSNPSHLIMDINGYFGQ